MSTFTKEQLIEKLKHIISVASGFPESEKAQMDLELARIALASLEAEPVCYLTWHQGFRAPDDCEEYVVEAKPGDKSCDGTPAFLVYSAPPAPAPAPVSDEDKVLAEQARAVIHCLDMCGVPSGDYADNEQLQLWGRVIEYGRHPASVSVPDGYRLQPISEYDAMCAAMLQGADGNSPVIPDGWKLVPIDPTKDMLRAGQSVVGFWLNTVHCYSKMLAAAPAAPKQEVTQALAKGMERYGDAMQKLADSGD